MLSAPNIQYAQTKDGLSIAYWTLGEGEPYIICFSSNLCETEWEFPEAREAYTALAEDRMVVRLDLRGEGLSSAPEHEPTLDELCMDVAAVADRIGAARYALHGGTYSTKVAVRHAAQRPGRVSALTLYGPNIAASNRRWLHPALEVIAPLRESHPDLFGQLAAVILAGMENPEFTRRFAKMGANYATGTHGAMRTGDVSHDVIRVEAPVLVMHRHALTHDVNVSRAIAAGFSRGRMAIVDGTLPMPWDEPAIRVIRPFLTEASGYSRHERRAPDRELPKGIALILYVDVVDSTVLTEKMGDVGFHERNRALDELLRTIIAESGGTVVEGKTLGDGVLATFPSAAQGISAATACASAGDQHGMPLHLGLHAGDVLREEGNVFGGAVIIASRISGLSAPGEVLVSGTVRELARTSSGVGFEDRGERELKGVGELVRVFRVISG